MKDLGCPVAAGEHVGEYRVQEILGSGGMGWVLAALHPVIEKKAAIKLLKPALAEDRDAMERFVAEAKAVNRIGHPNIVDIFAFGHTHGQIPYFVMEFLNAGSLRRLLKKGWRPGPRELVSLLDGVLSALQAAHDNGIVHRDLKPDNICIHKTSDRIVTKLVDFGVAKFTEAGIKSGTTRSGVPIGTPTYMAPEQCRGKNLDHRADIYALGVILYEVFTGQVPFASDSYLEVLLAHVEQQPRAPSEFADISPDFESIVLKCLAKDPDDRPESVADLRRALRSAAGLRERSRLELPSLDSMSVAESLPPAVASSPAKVSRPSSTVPSPSEISLVRAQSTTGPGLGPGPAPDPALSPTISSESLQAPAWSSGAGSEASASDEGSSPGSHPAVLQPSASASTRTGPSQSASASTRTGPSQSASSPSLEPDHATGSGQVSKVDSQKTWDINEKQGSRRKTAWSFGAGAVSAVLIAVVGFWLLFHRASSSNNQAAQNGAAGRRLGVDDIRKNEPGGKGVQGQGGKMSDGSALSRQGGGNVSVRSGSVVAADGGSLSEAGKKPHSDRRVIRVKTVPPGALILIDGKRCGPSPAVCHIPRGAKDVLIRALKAGWKPDSRVVDPETVESLTMKLRRKRRVPVRRRTRPRSNEGFVINP